MTRDLAMRLAESARLLAEASSRYAEDLTALADAGTRPPTSSSRSIDTLEHAPASAPGSMAELAGWFARLTPDQLKSAWVAAVVEAAREEHSIKDLAAALSAVRDHPNGALVVEVEDRVGARGFGEGGGRGGGRGATGTVRRIASGWLGREAPAGCVGGAAGAPARAAGGRP